MGGLCCLLGVWCHSLRVWFFSEVGVFVIWRMCVCLSDFCYFLRGWPSVVGVVAFGAVLLVSLVLAQCG